MKKITPTPHDALFKQFLTHPETAKDLLDIHLPAQLRDICDLTTLKLESGSFIEESLRPILMCSILLRPLRVKDMSTV